MVRLGFTLPQSGPLARDTAELTRYVDDVFVDLMYLAGGVDDELLTAVRT